jgi:alkylation response protein AidB-like acyl-CoA dehydrogenase
MVHSKPYGVIFSIVGFGKSVGKVLEVSRVSVAWIPVGICQGALEKTIEYVGERKAFGAYLSSNQIIQGKCNVCQAIPVDSYIHSLFP